VRAAAADPLLGLYRLEEVAGGVQGGDGRNGGAPAA
jgi:hypothetical protein